MRIGLIADIHANLHAFQAVLAYLKSQNIDMIWNAGDFLGYGPNPEEVVQQNKQAYILSILGNYDRKVLQYQDSGKIKAKNPLKRFAFQWAAEQLSPGSCQYLRELPAKVSLQMWNWKILLVHGSPDSDSEPIDSSTPLNRLEQIAEQSGAQFIISGHSHQSLSMEVNGTWFINPGSVGRQDDGDSRASFAILELSKSRQKVNHFRLDYQIDDLLAEAEKKNLPGEFRLMFQEGRNLDTILASANQIRHKG